MKPEPQHIGESAAFSTQKLEWKHIPLNTEIKIEIINFWRMRNVRHPSKDTWYAEFAGKLHTSIEGCAASGEVLIFNLPYKTFVRAITALPIATKKFVGDPKLMTTKDNVLMTMTKITKSSMVIHTFMLKQEDEELTFLADKILYKEILEIK